MRRSTVPNHHPLQSAFPVVSWPLLYLVHFGEEILDAVLVLNVVQHHKTLSTGGHETGNMPKGAGNLTEGEGSVQ